MVVGFVGALVALGALGTPAAAATSPTTPQTLDAPTLRAALLTAKDLPAGWVVDHSSHRTWASAGCSVPGARLAGPSSAQVSFQRGGRFPRLSEELVSGPGVPSAYGRLVQAMGHCSSALLTVGHHRYRGTLHARSFPRVAQSSAAFSMTFRHHGAKVVIDQVVAMKANVLLVVTQGGADWVDPSSFRANVHRAADRVPGGGTRSALPGRNQLGPAHEVVLTVSGTGPVDLTVTDGARQFQHHLVALPWRQTLTDRPSVAGVAVRNRSGQPGATTSCSARGPGGSRVQDTSRGASSVVDCTLGPGG